MGLVLISFCPERGVLGVVGLAFVFGRGDIIAPDSKSFAVILSLILSTNFVSISSDISRLEPLTTADVGRDLRPTLKEPELIVLLALCGRESPANGTPSHRCLC